MSNLFDPVAIEKKIDGLLSQTTRTSQRTSLLTLILVHHKRQADRVVLLLDSLFGKRPLRIIRIENGHSTPTTVDVSARCIPHPSGEEICFQEIVIYNGPDNRGFDRSLWSPLIIRDLPVALFWLESFSQLPLLTGDGAIDMDKFIVDTAEMCAGNPDNPLPALRRLADYASGLPVTGNIPLADLAWRGLERERHFTALLFDTAETLPFIKSLRRIELSGFAPCPQILMIAWLSGRLGLGAGKRSSAAFHFQDLAGGEVVVALTPERDRNPSISFIAEKNKILRADFYDNGDIKLMTPGSVRTEHALPLQTDESLRIEIDTLSHDPLFYEALDAVRLLAQ
jgi:hypothetical protein